VRGIPKYRDKFVRETHSMTKIREKCSAVRMAKKVLVFGLAAFY